MWRQPQWVLRNGFYAPRYCFRIVQGRTNSYHTYLSELNSLQTCNHPLLTRSPSSSFRPILPSSLQQCFQWNDVFLSASGGDNHHGSLHEHEGEVFRERVCEWAMPLFVRHVRTHPFCPSCSAFASVSFSSLWAATDLFEKGFGGKPCSCTVIAAEPLVGCSIFDACNAFWMPLHA